MSNLKPTLFLLSLLVLVSCKTTQLESGPSTTKTSTETTTETYAFQNFDKVELSQVNGNVTIAVGDAYAISVTGERDAVSQLKVLSSDKTLRLVAQPNPGMDYRRARVLSVSISVPSLAAVANGSNADVKVTGLRADGFSATNTGNGNLTLSGTSIGSLELENAGNGDLDARGLRAERVTVAKAGNGDVSVDTPESFTVSMSGNGNVRNVGKGTADVQLRTGNGKVVYDR